MWQTREEIQPLNLRILIDFSLIPLNRTGKPGQTSFKKNTKTDPANYRPISLTSVICRVLESMLRDVIVEHLVKHHLIHSTQHGFVPRQSCLTNLLEYLEKMTKLVDEGHNVDVFYLNFAKHAADPGFDCFGQLLWLCRFEIHIITVCICFVYYSIVW